MPTRRLALVLAFVAATLAAPAFAAEMPGWAVHKTSHSYPTLIERLDQAVKANKMGLVTRASATLGAKKMLKKDIAGNMVVGVSEGFSKGLEITGTGYRAAVQGQSLNLQLGYSHEINYPIPEGIEIKAERPTSLKVSGADKQKVGQVAAEIRAFRKPEPYKGKGIRYEDEIILRKEGKKK